MSSQNHRPGAKVTLSSVANLNEKLAKVENLETQLNKLSSKKGNDAEASKLRIQLCEVISDISLTDPEFAMKKDAIGRLWRACFYSPIQFFRQRITREKKKISNNATTNKGSSDSRSLNKLQKSLDLFIAEAITLYQYLISQYHSKLMHIYASGGGASGSSQSQQQQQQQQQQHFSQQSTFSQGSSSSFGGGGSGSQQQQNNNPAGVVSGLFRMYIHVGDLYRYDSKYKEAQQYYGNASKLSPGRGNPYNQIAVVAQLKDAAAPLNAVALYWYARSLLTTQEPFEISKANLARLFQSNRDWFHKQPRPPDDGLNNTNSNTDGHGGGHGGREMAKAQRSVASRHFLSQFVDLHYSFFQGIDTSANTDNNNNNNNTSGKGRLPTDQVVVSQIEAALTPLSVLLRNSAFGDPLLCKMVAICAFSEAYRPEENSSNNNEGKSSSRGEALALSNYCTKFLARIFTLTMGACLAERAAVGLAKIKDQPEKLGNPGKAPSSVRLLQPFLLICEYIESSPMNDDNNNNNDDDYHHQGMGSSTSSSPVAALSEETRNFCQKSIDTFWQRCIEVLNILTSLRDPLNLNNIEDWKNSTLKEFDTLIGFSPFQSFLTDAMVGSRDEDGYASVDEAVAVLRLLTREESHHSSTGTQESSTTTTPTTSNTSSAEEYKVKVARLLAFGDRMVEDSSTAAGRRFGRHEDGTYVWKDPEEVDDDAMMMDAEHLHENDTQPPMQDAGAKGGGDDVLVYSVPEGGGPALLVPGMLLQNLAMGNVTGDPTTTATTTTMATTTTNEQKPRSNSDGSFQPMQFGGAVAATAGATAAQPSPALAGLGLAMDARQQTAQQSALAAAAQGGSIMPPPGFGGGGMAPGPTAVAGMSPAAPMAQGHVAIPQGQIPGMASYGAPLVASPGGTGGALPPGFAAAGYGSVMPQQQQHPAQQQQDYHQPTVATSMNLFGGPEALKTANPFAAASMPAVDASGNMPLLDLNLGGAGAGAGAGASTSGSGASFLNPSGSRVAESTLLGSGLLHSLFEDSTGDKTSSKNPFAS